MYRSDDGVPARQRRVGTTVLAIVLGLVAALGAACSSSAADGAVADPAASTETTSSTVPQLPEDVSLPIVFVHGFAGSAQQYETQAMRFAANGYPSERIVAYDHDGAGMDIGAYADGVDQLIDETLAATGAEQVYLVGHSRGTIVSSAYLGDPTRAAKVAKYVAIDGGSCVDVVPCITPNQDALPGQAHVETATSPESFRCAACRIHLARATGIALTCGGAARLAVTCSTSSSSANHRQSRISNRIPSRSCSRAGR